MAGHSRQLVRFEVPIGQPGLYHGFVEVGGGDDLPFDDRRWLAFEARRPDRVLLVNGEPGPSVYGNETYYLETALRLGRTARSGRLPHPLRAGTPGLGPAARVPARAGPFRRRRPVQCRRRLARRRRRPAAVRALGRLRDHLHGGPGGGGAYAAAEKSGLVPGRLEGTAEDGSYRFAGWEKDHPLLAPFADPQYGDLRTLRFRKITRIVPDASSRVLATAQGGSPLLVERARAPASACCSRSRPTTPGASGPFAACICRWSIRRWAT